MPALCKLIFRLDFPYNYKFMDYQGTATRILNENVDKPWDWVGTEAVRHSIQALRRGELAFTNLVFEPLTINGTWEDISGLDLRKVTDADTFRMYDEKGSRRKSGGKLKVA